MLANAISSRHKLRPIPGWIAAAVLLVRAVLPMSMMMPLGLSELVICGAHGVETILVDQDMNRVNPDTPSPDDSEHCGICTIVFGLAWAIALGLILAPLPGFVSPRRGGVWRPRHNGFRPALPRAPPLFA